MAYIFIVPYAVWPTYWLLLILHGLHIHCVYAILPTYSLCPMIYGLHVHCVCSCMAYIHCAYAIWPTYSLCICHMVYIFIVPMLYGLHIKYALCHIAYLYIVPMPYGLHIYCANVIWPTYSLCLCHMAYIFIVPMPYGLYIHCAYATWLTYTLCLCHTYSLCTICIWPTYSPWPCFRLHALHVHWGSSCIAFMVLHAVLSICSQCLVLYGTDVPVHTLWWSSCSVFHMPMT